MARFPKAAEGSAMGMAGTHPSVVLGIYCLDWGMFPLLQCCPGRFLAIRPSRLLTIRVRRGADVSSVWFDLLFLHFFRMTAKLEGAGVPQCNRAPLSRGGAAIRQLLEPAVEIRSHLNTIENNQRCHWNWGFWWLHNSSVVARAGSHWLAVAFILFTDQFI